MAFIRFTFIIARVSFALAHAEQIEDLAAQDAVGLFQVQVQEARMKQYGDAPIGAPDVADGYTLAHTLNCRSREGSSQVFNGIAGKEAARPQEPGPVKGVSEEHDPPGARTLRLVLWLMVMGLLVDGAHRLRSQKQAAPAQEHVSGEVAKEDHDADANAESAWLEMVNAAASGDTQAFDKALTFNPSMARTDAWACTVLHFAATGGAVPIVAELLRRGAEVDARDASNETPLHFAARAGHVEICKALLDARADADAVSSEDMTPLVIAGFANQEPVCRFLADSGAGVAGLLDQQLPPLVVSQVVRKMFAAA